MLIFAGLATGDIVALNMRNNDIALIGTHNAPICFICWVKEINVLISLGFDNVMRFWGLENNNGNFMQMEYILPEKTNTASFDYPYLLIGSSESNVMIFNLKTLPNL
eukprot:GHVR01123895.1.p1 GENE.GHVR01123895.1~~GHVR01123895.1.p1  ORF type:complete len:107 (+),score=2.78 GHVR01123895.1:3332-3652(+)